MSLDEYYVNLMADIRREADASGVMMVEAFFDQMADRLTESGEIDTAHRAFYQTGEGNRKIRLDGYSGDPRDTDGILGLIVCDFVDSDEPKTFAKAEAMPILNSVQRFITKARDPDFKDSLNEVSPAFQVSDLIILTWSHITKIKLIILSNRKYIGRDDSVKLTEIGGIPLTLSVWDLARFERFDQSGQAREDMVVDFEGDFGGAVPALEASKTRDAMESYLLVVPGAQLAEIYDRWGARLLEANVRSFLQARAKTNKGIQKTIKEEPALFFPYNNGLSATAEEVALVRNEKGLAISSVRNLQIVNGAQTTGSIHTALNSAPEQIPYVFVQMKLTVVPPERAEEVVPKISEYANTQNKVNAADFFSNHPFHVRMEEFSRRVIFAAKEGERHDNKWFYERSRGQYLNERSKRSGAERRKFDLEYPKPKMFTKTDLAKFEFSAAGNPHIVSKGAQKNFAEFAKEIGQAWSKGDSQYDELWFKRLVAKALIFRRMEAEIPRQTWYEGGYRANIVTYSIAKVFHDASKLGHVLDIDSVWRKQDIPSPLLDALLLAAEAAHEIITNPPSGVRNFSEWAKQQGCWSWLKTRAVNYGRSFDSCLILADSARSAEKEARAEAKMKTGIEAQTEVVELGGDFWKSLLNKARATHELSLTEDGILEACTLIPKKVPTEKQCVVALNILAKLKNQGIG